MLKEKLEEMAKQTVAKVPAEVLAVAHSATKAVAESIASRKIPKAGGVLPGFQLVDSKENQFDSNDHLTEGHLVVTFFRGGW